MPHNSRYLQSEWSQDYLLMSNSIKKTSHYLQITWKASKHQWLGAQTHCGKLNISACFQKVRLWYFYWVSFGLLMSPMNEMFSTSIHDNEVSVASFFCSRCPNKFGIGSKQCSEAQKCLRAKRVTVSKNMYFCSKKLRFEHFFINCKMKMSFMKQVFFNLLNELKHNKICFKNTIFILQLAKKC